MLYELIEAIIKGNKNFLVTESYLQNGDFVMKFKPQEKVLQYQGKYKYVLYKLSDSKFKKVKEETFDIDTKEFSVKVKMKCIATKYLR